MPPAIQVGTVLIDYSSSMTQFFSLETEPYAENWGLTQALDGFALDRKIRLAGWNFFFMADELKATFFGAVQANSIPSALRRLLLKVKGLHFNSLEITAIVAKKFLGVPYTVVSCHPRHIQESCYLDDDETRQVRSGGVVTEMPLRGSSGAAQSILHDPKSAI